MSTVCNKNHIEIRYKQATHLYNETDWWINPEIPECEQMYMKIGANGYEAMTSLEITEKNLELIEDAKYYPKDITAILQDIFAILISDDTKKEKLKGLLKEEPFFMWHLFCQNYEKARETIQKYFDDGLLDQTEYDLLDSKIPKVKE